MEITLAQLVFGFRSGMTMQGLANYLGVPIEDVRARLRVLTPEEEQKIDEAMKGRKFS